MNKKEKIYEALTNVKREYVEEAERFNFKKRRISFSRILGMAAAACLAVVLFAVAMVPKQERGKPNVVQGEQSTDAPISMDEKLLVFHRPNSLIEFFAAPELSDAEFARFIRANGYERFGIVTKDDLRAVIDLMNEIPFPIRADLDFNVFHIKLDGETNSYCAQYWLDEGGIGRVCAFSGDLRGELSSADMIDRISNSGEPVDFAEHEHIKRLNLRRDDETFRFMADIDGRLVNISLQAHSVEEALETVLAFDFGRMGDNPPSIVASLWSGIENLDFCFESREELAAFISSLDMQDAEFNGFIEKYNDYFVNTKADVIAVLSKAEGIVFPQPEGRIFNLMGIGLSSELEGTFSLRYDLSKGKELWIDIYSEPNSRLEDMGAEVFAVELAPSSPIRELRGVSRKTAFGDGRWRETQYFSGRLGERFIRIEAMNCTRSEAESLIRSFGYETLESLAFPSNTDSELPYYPIYLTGLDELKEFASAAAMSDAEFERYLERNAQNMFGIRSPIDAARALEYLDSFPFPISAEQALGSIVFTPADGEYIIRYDTCSFRSCAEYGENGLFATFDEIAAALNVSIIDTGSHAHIGKLCKLNRDVPEELDLPTYYAEIDGKLVEITAFSRPAEKAVEEILSFDFGSASEFVYERAADDPGVPQLLKPGAENLLYFTDLDALKAFLDSPELSDEEFEQFVSEKLDPAMGIVTKEDARAVIGRIEQIPFPMTADLEPSGFEFYFYNKSEGNYLYSIEYSMPDGGICSFFGQLEGEYSLAKDIEAYASSASPVDFEGNAFVNRLYYESFGDVQVFYADIGGRIVNAQFRNLTYDEALEALLSFGFESIIESVIKSDPWYLEKAWEYAEFVNREYGFNFIKGEAKFNEADMSITFTHIESEEYINPQNIWICFDKTEKAVKHVYISGDGSDRPEEYASMSDEELKAVFDQLDLFATYSVTREDMLQAGYTLDGTDEDYVKIAEYCGKLKAAELENAPELHFYRCIEAEIGNARRNTEASVKNSTDPVYCWVTYYFRPAYPKLFTHNTADIGCNMTLLDDAEHPGWIYFGGDVLITPTAEGWSCQLAYISGY